MPYTPNNLVGAALYQGRSKIAVFSYDFAVDGGAVSAITLRGEALPVGAVMIDALIVLRTALTSGGAATVSLGLQTAADIRAAATLSTAPVLDATTGAKRAGAITAVSQVVTVATTAKSVVATVGTAALTAGKFDVLVTYLELAS